jgi:hypothetical protein
MVSYFEVAWFIRPFALSLLKGISRGQWLRQAQPERTASGGLTPWAVIGSNATDGEIGGLAFVTNAV